MATRLFRILIVLAAIMGADGVMLAAASAHQPDAARLASASSMLLFHALAVLAAVALAERGVIDVRIGIVAGWGFVIASALFAGDLTMRQYAGHGLFPMAAPTGGTLLIVTHNEASLLRRVLGAKWPPFCLQHPQVYSPASITRLIADAGYRQIEVGPTRNYFPIGFLIRQAAWTVGIKLDAVPLPTVPVGLKLGNIVSVTRR